MCSIWRSASSRWRPATRIWCNRPSPSRPTPRRHLRSYRIDVPGQIWLQAQVDRALAGAQDRTPQRGLRRGDLMALVDEVEVLLAQREAADGDA